MTVERGLSARTGRTRLLAYWRCKPETPKIPALRRVHMSLATLATDSRPRLSIVSSRAKIR